MATRRQQIAQNIRAPQRGGTGGALTAPRSASKGPTTGLSSRRVAPSPVGNAKAVGGLSAPPQPGAPPPASPQPMPWDVAAANSEAAAGKRLSNTIAGLDAGWLRSQQEYGLEGQWADYASNPYSRAALLQRSYDAARRGTMNTAGRQLYAGSYINSQNANTHQFNVGRDDLQRAYDAANAEYVGSKARAEDAYREALAQAGWERVNAGLQAPPEPAPAGPAAAPAAPAAPVRPAKAKQQPKRKQQIKQNISNARKVR